MSSELSRRERKKLESRERLVECAAALFASRGYDATTMEDIGECADVSRATVFNYFPRKEDLVLAWFDARRADLAAVFTRSDGDHPDTPALFRQVFGALAHIFEDDPHTGRAMVRAWLAAGGPLLTPDSDTTHLFADAISAGQQHGDIDADIDAHAAGTLLFDAYSGALYRWVTANNEHAPLEPALLAILDLVLTGIAAPASRQP